MSRERPDSQPNPTPQTGCDWRTRALLQAIPIVCTLLIYCYPSLRTWKDLGPTPLPPMFSPDLSLYLNLGNITTIGGGQAFNPYYLVPVPSHGTGYLKFRSETILFRALTRLLFNKMAPALFIWNLFWWGLLCVIALRLFRRWLPPASGYFAVSGLCLLMLFNFGVIKPLLSAWLHLPSLSGFQNFELPFMRPFVPQVPIVLLLAYLGLQIAVLRNSNIASWMAMWLLQFSALTVFPFSTLMMVGITLVSALWALFFAGWPRAWRSFLTYAVACGVSDVGFLKFGSLNLYGSRAPAIHFQPQLLPHLIGLAWLFLFVLVLLVAFNSALAPEVKWPLVGLGAASLLLMPGDAFVPAPVLLLSTHAGYFTHTTDVILCTFIAPNLLAGMRTHFVTRVAIGILSGLLLLNGIFTSVATYKVFAPFNREVADASHLLSSLAPEGRELFIAPSTYVVNLAGWIVLLPRQPVLFCTDAALMLTPEQLREVAWPREALYLYFSGEDSSHLERAIVGKDFLKTTFALGFRAEATSLSREEQLDAVRTIRADLIPKLQEVEAHSATVTQFLAQFERIVVIDNSENRSFSPTRLASYLRLESEQRLNNLILQSYVPR